MSLAGVNVSIRELYETNDRNYHIFVAEVVDRAMFIKTEAMRNG